MEEPWVRKGVAFAYRQRVHSGYLLLLASFFGIGGVFALDLAWTDFLARRRTGALKEVVGWRPSRLCRLGWQGPRWARGWPEGSSAC